MRKLSLSAAMFAIALGALTAASAGHAADLAAKAPSQVVPAWPAWTGFYGGFSAGYGSNYQGTTVTDGTNLAIFGDSPHGVTGGLRLGYDWQVGYLVIGLETDGHLAGFDSNSGLSGLSIQNSTTWWGSTNVRAGLSIFGDHWLPYAFGGLAYGGAKTVFSAPTFSAGVSDVRSGWNAGGGLEVRVTPHVSAFGEWRYMSLGQLSTPINDVMIGTQPQAYTVVMGGLNYRF